MNTISNVIVDVGGNCVTFRARNVRIEIKKNNNFSHCELGPPVSEVVFSSPRSQFFTIRTDP